LKQVESRICGSYSDGSPLKINRRYVPEDKTVDKSNLEERFCDRLAQDALHSKTCNSAITDINFRYVPILTFMEQHGLCPSSAF
jgi:hypothetical protein